MMTREWERVKIADVLTPVSRPVKIESTQTYRILGMRWYAKGLFIKEVKAGHEIQAEELYQVGKGDFVYNRLFAWKGSFGIVGDETSGGYVSGEFPCFIPLIEKVYPIFLHYYLSQEPIWNYIARISSGQTNISRLRLKVADFFGIEIPLPSLDEQRRIVARIEALAARVSEAHKLGREAIEKAEKLVDEKIDEIFLCLKNKPVKPLSELTLKIGSGSTPKGGRSIYPESGIPFIRSMNVRMRRFQWNDIAFIDYDTHKAMQGTRVKFGDVLLNITGASIGRVTCAPENLVEGNVNQHVAIIRPINELIPRFLMYWLSQSTIQEFINSEQKGATRQGFTKSQIEKFLIPILNTDEQERIVAYLDNLQAEVDLLKAMQFETQDELDALMPSILDKAFKGEL